MATDRSRAASVPRVYTARRPAEPRRTAVEALAGTASENDLEDIGGRGRRVGDGQGDCSGREALQSASMTGEGLLDQATAIGRMVEEKLKELRDRERRPRPGPPPHGPGRG